MARTGPTATPISWNTSPITLNDGSEIDPFARQDSRPKRRIRRSMTACNTCRRLKTRCDVDPRGHSCHRCLSLRLDCELPETTERICDNVSAFFDENSTPLIEERLVSLERSMGEMRQLMRQLADRSQSKNYNLTPRARDYISKEIFLSDNVFSSTYPLNPAQRIQPILAESFGERDHLSDVNTLGDIVTQGIVHSELSMKLIELFVVYFGHWVSINHWSEIQQSNALLFNTACLVASRYLPCLPRNTVHNISLQVQHAVATLLWKPTPMTIDMLQAFTLLCLYSTSIHNEEEMEESQLNGFPVSHTLVSFNFGSMLSSGPLNPDELLAHLRLWNTLCAAQLYSAFADGRDNDIQPEQIDQYLNILEHTAATPEDERIVAEIQLYRIALRIQHHHYCLRFAKPDFEELESWKMEWAHLQTTGEHSVLNLNVWFCQLVLCRKAASLQPPSEIIVLELCGIARSIIIQFLQMRFKSAPALIDRVYFIVSYAALTLCDYTHIDPLISELRSFLLNNAPGGDDLLYRMACIVGEVQRRNLEANIMTAGSYSSSPVWQVNSMRMFDSSNQQSSSMDVSQCMYNTEGLNYLIEGDDSPG